MEQLSGNNSNLDPRKTLFEHTPPQTPMSISQYIFPGIGDQAIHTPKGPIILIYQDRRGASFSWRRRIEGRLDQGKIGIDSRPDLR
jgi:hypothetical protein